MSVTWTPVSTSRDPDSLDHLRVARALLEQAIVALGLAAELSGADPSGESIGQVRASVSDALGRIVERIEGVGDVSASKGGGGVESW